MTDIALDGTIYHPYLGDIEHDNEECRQVLQLVRRWDGVRIDSFGGYPSEVMFVFGTNGAQVWPELVAMATVVDGSREPSLSLMTLAEFIANHRSLEEAP